MKAKKILLILSGAVMLSSYSSADNIKTPTNNIKTWVIEIKNNLNEDITIDNGVAGNDCMGLKGDISLDTVIGHGQNFSYEVAYDSGGAECSNTGVGVRNIKVGPRYNKIQIALFTYQKLPTRNDQSGYFYTGSLNPEIRTYRDVNDFKLREEISPGVNGVIDYAGDKLNLENNATGLTLINAGKFNNVQYSGHLVKLPQAGDNDTTMHLKFTFEKNLTLTDAYVD